MSVGLTGAIRTALRVAHAQLRRCPRVVVGDTYSYARHCQTGLSSDFSDKRVIMVTIMIHFAIRVVTTPSRLQATSSCINAFKSALNDAHFNRTHAPCQSLAFRYVGSVTLVYTDATLTLVIVRTLCTILAQPRMTFVNRRSRHVATIITVDHGLTIGPVVDLARAVFADQVLVATFGVGIAALLVHGANRRAHHRHHGKSVLDNRPDIATGIEWATN